jgi:prepilin-type N-terminal cleavage/methylation domain-containing protein
MRISNGGFTLIEVLGAVAILAILYTTLATVAIRGLRSEGESRRMLEASLLADWELSEFELELQTGAAPEIGLTNSEEEDGFTVTWEVTPFQTAIFKSASEREQDRKASNPAGQPAPIPAGPTGTANAGAEPFLRVELRVSWFEAGNERSVTRTIFAVDEDAAARLAAASVLDEGTVESERP